MSQRDINNTYIGFTQQTDKLEFGEERPGIEQHCHSEPVRTLVWESPSNSGQPIVIHTALLHHFHSLLTKSGASNRGIATPVCELARN
ncbi:MAG: hypothetical protein PUJ12_08760, partial [Oscillospiraceae bacterium]|nr:hypothetical protein [Oscillospiraceae bacterium]